MRLGDRERFDIRLCFLHCQPGWREGKIGEESETKECKYWNRKRERKKEEAGMN